MGVLTHPDDPEVAASRRFARTLARQAEVARLYRSGESQIEIARMLGVAQKLIVFDLAKLRADWRASSIRDFDALREKELERVDKLELEAWNAWERSIRHDQPDGNPTFLDLVKDCIRERCKLLGLYAPTKSDSTVSASVVVASTFLGRDEMKSKVLEFMERRGRTAALAGSVASASSSGGSDGAGDDEDSEAGDADDSLGSPDSFNSAHSSYSSHSGNGHAGNSNGSGNGHPYRPS